MPAQAEIQDFFGLTSHEKMDAGLRRHDGRLIQQLALRSSCQLKLPVLILLDLAIFI